MAEETRKGREHLLGFLSGVGIEIGALHRPVYAPHLNIRYVDRLTRDELFECYPELRGQSIVETDILDNAESLGTIRECSQDFVIANHVIEHMRNPISSLLNWQRVLKQGGKLFLAVPNKHTTFDQEREITSLQHVLDDYVNPSESRDFQAFLDFSKYVSCRFFKVKPESDFESFAKELEAKDYSIHFHVWDKPAFDQLLAHMERSFSAWRLKILDYADAAVDEFVYVLVRI
ncbi:MAG: methyltransferase domain-containing protein [Deltaproteobacteria bacterium]|nr:methyltransferase domain-containing protein [Deltaproteobacteria bacterium]